MKLNKSYLFLFLIFFAVGVMVWNIYSDINLDLNRLIENLENMPGLVLENLEFERQISGELWQVRVPVATRRNNIIEIRSVDVLRTLADGSEWFFMGAHGLYSEVTESADLTRLLGTLETSTRVLNLESPFLSWAMSEDVLLFPKGLILYDAEFLLETNLASLDESGTIALNEGAVIRWRNIAE